MSDKPNRSTEVSDKCKCPHCGAGIMTETIGYMEYWCHSWQSKPKDAGQQSDLCRERAKVSKLREALEGLLLAIGRTEINCARLDHRREGLRVMTHYFTEECGAEKFVNQKIETARKAMEETK